MFSISVGLMANKMRTFNNVFDVSSEQNVIREVLVEAEWFSAIQERNRSALKNTTNPKVSVVRMMTLHIRIKEYSVRVVFGVIRHLTVPVLLGTSFIDRFVMGIFSTDRKIVPYISKAELVLDIKNKPDECKEMDKAQDGSLIGANTPRLVQAARKTKIVPISEGVVLVATDTRRLLKQHHCKSGTVLKHG